MKWVDLLSQEVMKVTNGCNNTKKPHPVASSDIKGLAQDSKADGL